MAVIISPLKKPKHEPGLCILSFSVLCHHWHPNIFVMLLQPALNQLKNEAIDKLNELEEARIRIQTVLDQVLTS